MKIKNLISTLRHIEASQGNIDVVLQDSTSQNEKLGPTKHEQFFVVEESLAPNPPSPDGHLQEVVLRTWPY